MPLRLPFLSGKKTTELFFGLFLKEEEVVGYVIEKGAQGITILSEEKRPLTGGWDAITENVDELLFSLESKHTIHLEQLIFFVFSNLVDQQTKEIKKPYIDTCKSLAKHLELKPLGFIECHEAVAKLLEKRSQAPLTAILIELDKTNAGVFVYKGGQRIFSETVARTAAITDDLEAVFSKIKGEILLPSRIVLYDSSDLHNESTAILSHRWDQELFVQFPRVEIVKPDELSTALVAAFQGQTGGNISEDSIHRAATDDMTDEDEMSLDSDEKDVEEEKPKKEVMGFVIGGDVEPDRQPQVRSQSTGSRGRFAPVMALLDTVRGYFAHSVTQLQGMKTKKVPVLVAVGLLLIGGSLFTMEYLLHKATVNVFFPARAIEKELDVVLPLSGVNDSFSLSIATVSADFTEKRKTSGKRDVGEEAKGDVTIHNFDDKERNFAKGTVLDQNGITYVLNDEVKVASSSLASDGSAKLPGKSKGSVTAEEIGTEGNIDKGERLKVGDLSQSLVFAITDTAFTGGSKKQVQTVSTQDIDTLKTAILSKAKKELVEKINDSTDKNGELLSQLTETTFGKITPSKEVGEESSDLSVKATVKTTYYTYSPKEVRAYIRSEIGDDVEDGFKLEEDKIEFELTDVKKTANRITFSIVSEAKSVKEVAAADIAEKIKGKKTDEIEAVLKEEFNATGFEMDTAAPLFFFENWAPLFKKNISVTVSSL
jgi:hypothetical protein